MSVEEAYAVMGGDLECVRRCLPSEDHIIKYMRLFLQDDSLEVLENALDNGDFAEAYRGAHTLKGMSRDLGFTPLCEPSAALSDALKLDDMGLPKEPEKVAELLPLVREAHALVVQALEIIDQ